MRITTGCALIGVAAALVALPAPAQEASLLGTWAIEGQNRMENCLIWVPSGELRVTQRTGQNVYRGEVNVRGVLRRDKNCRAPPGGPDQEETDEFRSPVVLSVEKDIVTIREEQLQRAFRYRWTNAGLEFTQESCREGASGCVETTFRYVRRGN
jgi:hypothetical protein